jgi:hypothetical protein
MRSQTIISLALIAFTTSSFAAAASTYSLAKREPYPEDVRAAIVAVGEDFAHIDARESDDVATLLAAADANHNSQKRAEADDVETLLAAANANHNSKRADANDVETLLATANANHNSKRADVDDLFAAAVSYPKSRRNPFCAFAKTNLPLGTSPKRLFGNISQPG